MLLSTKSISLRTENMHVRGKARLELFSLVSSLLKGGAFLVMMVMVA